ncbi:hypothetical protein KH5_09600 [Urechidicola sp. KH5]
MELKQRLYNYCQQFVQTKLDTLERRIDSLKGDLNSETKSSAGDKHETGRAMLQLEMEKSGAQLQEALQMKGQLERINLEASEVVRLGSLVQTNTAAYFIAISAGQIAVDGNLFFAVSANSPIGKELLGRAVNDEFSFAERKIRIKKIA